MQIVLALVALSDAPQSGDQEVTGLIPEGSTIQQHSFIEVNQEIFF